jgi:hypothetical protein
MSLSRLVVTAVRIEGRTKAEVSRDYYGVLPRWVYELCRRFDTEGEAGLAPRSRRPRTSPQWAREAVEEEIIQLRKELSDQGLDAGAHTIAFHLSGRPPCGDGSIGGHDLADLEPSGFRHPPTPEAAEQPPPYREYANPGHRSDNDRCWAREAIGPAGG